jgi:hypothetical protein
MVSFTPMFFRRDMANIRLYRPYAILSARTRIARLKLPINAPTRFDWLQ